MSIRMLDDDNWLVQVQRGGIRKTKRGVGGRPAAEQVEEELIRRLEIKLKAKRRAQEATEEPTKKAFQTIELETQPDLTGETTLRDYYEQRWVAHARVTQNVQTQSRNIHKWNYLFHYLGDRTLNECLLPQTINRFVEQMLANGPISFCKTKSGNRRKLRTDSLTAATVNKSLQCLKAALNLAYLEGTVNRRPKFRLLPEDDSRLVLPPTEVQYQKLLLACEDLRYCAPYLPEVVAFAAHTGMRRTEIFTLTWGSVDLKRRAIRVERQARTMVVNQQIWKPKHGRAREIPMTDTVCAILKKLHRRHPHEESDLVIPNQGGSPYYPMYRVDTEPSKGRGYFYVAVAEARLKGKATFHGLRHLFAVRLLTKGVPITVVSELLGHSDIQLTVKRYGRYASDAAVKFDAIKVLDGKAWNPIEDETR